jgi:hypothetical protein
MMSAVLLHRAPGQTTGSMADTSLLANKHPGPSKTHRQDLVLPVVVVNLSVNLHVGPLVKRRLRNLTMGD